MRTRRLIRDAVAGTDDDLVIFCGSGATAALNKLVGILELRLPAGLAARCRLLDHIPSGQRPVVFIGPYEHHSKELPWRGVDRGRGGHRRGRRRPHRPGRTAAGSGPVRRPAAASRQLLRCLQRHRHPDRRRPDRRSAAPPRRVVVLGLRRGRPYVPIRMFESRPGADDHKDAIFLSAHKFVGGPQTFGVLVVRRDLVRNRVPTAPGGGTVAFVDPLGHR